MTGDDNNGGSGKELPPIDRGAVSSFLVAFAGMLAILAVKYLAEEDAVSLFAMIGFPFGAVSVALGFRSLRRIKRAEVDTVGRGFAMWAVALGALELLISVLATSQNNL